MMAFPIVSATACAAIALLLIVLTVRVTILRQTEGILLGTGENDRLRRAVRAQGNLAETAPILVLLFLLLEISGFAHLPLVWLATFYVAGRLAHAAGLSLGGCLGVLRPMGAATTLLVMLAATALLIRQLIGII